MYIKSIIVPSKFIAHWNKKSNKNIHLFSLNKSYTLQVQLLSSKDISFQKNGSWYWADSKKIWLSDLSWSKACFVVIEHTLGYLAFKPSERWITLTSTWCTNVLKGFKTTKDETKGKMKTTYRKSELGLVHMCHVDTDVAITRRIFTVDSSHFIPMVCLRQ